MSEVLFIFTAGLGGVFLSMTLLYASMRFTALILKKTSSSSGKGDK
ncbi:MAG: hypothetical protein V2I97_09210 [Desulfococcaceae bacterium]|jgi:hypothetical protein|nr:hypothetical protein [Desulfococcaceae bacterium]